MPAIAIIDSDARGLTHFRGPLIQALKDKGVRVLALAPNFQPATRAAVEDLGAEPVSYSLSRTGMNPLRDLRDLVRLTLLLRRLQPDVVLCYAVKPVLYGMLAAHMAGISRSFGLFAGLGYLFGVQHGDMSFGRRLLRWLVSKMLGRSLRYAEEIFFQNPDDLRDFRQAGILPATKGVVIGATGIALDQWEPAPAVTDPVTFLLAARLLQEKGIVEFATAARKIKSSYPETRFILLGRFDENPNGIRPDQVEGWVKEGLIEWPGHVPVEPWLKQASVYVLPSFYREGVPRSIQEAMAMGRAVITTDAPGCRETVVDGENGFLIPVRNVDALVERMNFFVENPSQIYIMGLASRRLAEERFDAEKINRRLMSAMGL